MSNNFFDRPVLRSLFMSAWAMDVLGQIRVVLNMDLSVQEVRDLLTARNKNFSEIDRLKKLQQNPKNDVAGAIDQVECEIRQQNYALALFFSTIWQYENGQPIPVEEIMRLHGIVGPGETGDLTRATLSELTQYQATDKGGMM